ncbi:eukaryotic translation initiation factor 3 subunit K [Sarcoptes scabiei]|nr:eukaryotic translation initiation factor 3 subunit K [Sarcoptes scabiei]
METVLVTGGSGLVGKAIQNLIERFEPDQRFHYEFVAGVDLTDLDATKSLFEKIKPNYVIHLAAMVGGLYKNEKNNLDFFRVNMAINDNVLSMADKYKVKKCVSCLSTCIFPDQIQYPIDEKMIHLGPPHSSNYGYSYAKRMIDILNRAYMDRNQSSESDSRPIFTSIIPTNVYGPNDNFNLEDGHVIACLIHKAYLACMEAKAKNSTSAELIVLGSGEPRRQFIYCYDLAKLIIWVIENYEEKEPIILSVDESEEISIKDVAELIAESMRNHFTDINLSLKFDHNFSDGQFKKTASNKKLRKYLPEYQFIPMFFGIEKTVKWFIENYNQARK